MLETLSLERGQCRNLIRYLRSLCFPATDVPRITPNQVPNLLAWSNKTEMQRSKKIRVPSMQVSRRMKNNKPDSP